MDEYTIDETALNAALTVFLGEIAQDVVSNTPSDPIASERHALREAILAYLNAVSAPDR